MMNWEDPKAVGVWLRAERELRGWSQGDVADRLTGLFRERIGGNRRFKQQTIGQVENFTLKSVPDWAPLLTAVFQASDDETKEDPYLSTGKTDEVVAVRHLPTHVGLGGGGTFEGDEGVVYFSRSLVELELKVPADALLAMVAEGNSMEPDFKGGDQILVDTRRKSLAQPGAFCLWDGDGHVIKFLEKIPDSDPPKVRVISMNALYRPAERLLDEINLVGRVIWYGRRVQ